MMKLKIRKTDTLSEAKTPITDDDIRRVRFPRLNKAAMVVYFYARQTLEAAAILVAGWVPIDITHNYVYNIELSTKKVTIARNLEINTNLQILTTVSSILFSAAILFVLAKINWRWSKADINPKNRPENSMVKKS